MRAVSIAPVFGLALMALGPASARAADAAHGETIARRWCASCHVVAPDQAKASTDAPTFADVARRKADKELAAFLVDPHPKMPDLHLTREEIGDIVAYIRTLAPKAQ